MSTSVSSSTNRQAKPKIIWLNTLVFLITFLVAAIGVPFYAYFYGIDTATTIAFIICTGFCGMSITAGYHRLWSHRAYETNAFFRFMFAIGGAFSIQNSALHWSSDHRIHHKHVDDNDNDPYSAKMGFWYSHIGWMLREYQAHRYHDYKNVRDLQRDPIVMWQHKNYLALVLITNFGIPLLFGWLNGDILASLLLIGFMRLVVSHHVTFFINSLAHMWGKQPYSDQNTAKDNPIVALLTYGEGYHNYHHAFQSDYRNAIKWWQFDPTKWFIKSMSWIGLTKNLKTIPEEKIIAAIAHQQFNKTQVSLIKKTIANKDLLLESLQFEYELLQEKMQAFYQAKKTWVETTKDDMLKSVDKSELALQLQELKHNWIQQHRNWQVFIQQYT
jgi:stearoyl-CoA desaturase (Delta-9 desaturase)